MIRDDLMVALSNWIGSSGSARSPRTGTAASLIRLFLGFAFNTSSPQALSYRDLFNFSNCIALGT